MGFLRYADPASTVRYTHDEDTDTWLEIYASLSKGQMNQLLTDMPDAMLAPPAEGEGTMATAALVVKETPQLTRALFRLLVAKWSLDDEPTVEKYLALESDPAGWIDRILYEHLNGMGATKEEVKKPTTSAKASRKVIRETD
jgi:hypothetical protein